jgi:hypothetical protein
MTATALSKNREVRSEIVGHGESPRQPRLPALRNVSRRHAPRGVGQRARCSNPGNASIGFVGWRRVRSGDGGRRRMRVRPIVRLCVVAALSWGLAGSVVSIASSTPALAAVHKKHPPKHKKKPKKTSSSSTSAKLKALASGVAAEKGATFEITYAISTAGENESVTFAQAPPDYLVKLGSGGEVIHTSSQTLYCSASMCVSEAGATNPMSSLEGLFSPTAAKTFFEEAQAEVGSKIAGYSISFSSANFTGLDSECATVNSKGQTEKFCVAKIGLLTYESSAAGSIKLTAYSSSVPSTAFVPPSGSTVITEPST